MSNSFLLPNIQHYVPQYCECYAGNVKCTACCRCVGCKNMGNATDFPDYRDPEGSAMGMPMAAAGYPVPPPPHRAFGMGPHEHPQHQQQQQQAGDHWGAAQSLTFLKRGSPASDRKHPFTLGVSPVTKASPGVGGAGDITSMPSLASSSDGTSPGDARNRHISSTPEDANKRQDDALLLAAVAMTEFGQSPPPSSVKQSPPSSDRTATTSNQFGGSDDGDTQRLSKRAIDFEDSSSSRRFGSELKKPRRVNQV